MAPRCMAPTCLLDLYFTLRDDMFVFKFNIINSMWAMLTLRVRGSSEHRSHVLSVTGLTIDVNALTLHHARKACVRIRALNSSPLFSHKTRMISLDASPLLVRSSVACIRRAPSFQQHEREGGGHARP
jgi:hypothetical protein